MIENDVWDGPITRVTYAKADFAPDTWHTLRLEIIGNTVLTTGNGVTVVGTYEKFGLPKTSLWLATGLSTHELRNLRIYAARPDPSWTPPAKAGTPPSAPKKPE